MLSFEQNLEKPNIFKLKSIEKEINTDFLELFTQALKIVSDEIKKKDEELGQQYALFLS